MKNPRVKHFTLVLYAVGLLLSPRILQAQIHLPEPRYVVVGTCTNLPFVTIYTTIGAAVAAAPAGSTVMVCPGTYPEQVVITTPLTLKGVQGGNTNRAIIVPPTGGLQVNAMTIVGNYMAAQVLVETGPVNITNITVDGTNNGVCVPFNEFAAGIYYGSGSSGTVNGVTARQQIACGNGVGIWAENGTSTMKTVSIENSDIHDVDGTGILTVNLQSPPTLTVAVRGNTVTGEYLPLLPSVVGPSEAIFNAGATGTIANNVMSEFQIGIYDMGSTVLISNNTMTNILQTYFVSGITLAGTDEVVTGNIILNNNNPDWPPPSTYPGSSGIDIFTSSATVQDNKIANNDIGIEFNCNNATVSGNTINDAAIGIDSVPSSLAVRNTYFNVDTVQGATKPPSPVLVLVLGAMSSCSSGRGTNPALLPKKLVP
jgi:hypothetical protein